ncbi:MAG: peroxiredoxin family protein [Acidobacteriaceae bacterium]
MEIMKSEWKHNASAKGFGVLHTLATLVAFACVVLVVSSASAQTPPAVGSKAPDFTLETPTGHSISLAEMRAKGTVVLVLLRGYPGYQCPYCTKQVHDFVEHGADFAGKKANVLFVYPGPPAALDEHAKEFLTKQANLPSNINLVIDPDYKMTNLYGLRWDAPQETSYASTFILNQGGKILFEKVSHSHGDRTSAEDVLGQLKTN